jgi:hypothetical protein
MMIWHPSVTWCHLCATSVHLVSWVTLVEAKTPVLYPLSLWYLPHPVSTSGDATLAAPNTQQPNSHNRKRQNKTKSCVHACTFLRANRDYCPFMMYGEKGWWMYYSHCGFPSCSKVEGRGPNLDPFKVEESTPLARLANESILCMTRISCDFIAFHQWLKLDLKKTEPYILQWLKLDIGKEHQGRTRHYKWACKIPGMHVSSSMSSSFSLKVSRLCSFGVGTPDYEVVQLATVTVDCLSGSWLIDWLITQRREEIRQGS